MVRYLELRNDMFFCVRGDVSLLGGDVSPHI